MTSECSAFWFSAVRIVFRYMRRAEPSRYETVANALCIFAVDSSVDRHRYVSSFRCAPEQVFADRYLAWPCLFWSGLTLLLLDDACRSGKRTAIGMMLAGCFVLPFAALANASLMGGMVGSGVSVTERAAAAARSDVVDAEVFPNDA